MMRKREDNPEFVRGKTYSLMKDPLQILRGNRFEVLEVITSKNYKVKKKDIKYLDRTPGTGRGARNGQQVTFHYELYENGDFENPVESTYSRGHNPKVCLGNREVCEGLEIGIEGMKVDGVRRIVVPPALSCKHKFWCFGCKKYKVFDVQLLSIEK